MTRAAWWVALLGADLLALYLFVKGAAWMWRFLQ